MDEIKIHLLCSIDFSSSVISEVVLSDPWKVVLMLLVCRLVGIVRSMSKFPTYRRRHRHVMKLLVTYSVEKEGSFRSSASNRSVPIFEITQLEV
jgi:hypothetical protein